jgi:hypothetical protein
MRASCLLLLFALPLLWAVVLLSSLVPLVCDPARGRSTTIVVDPASMVEIHRLDEDRRILLCLVVVRFRPVSQYECERTNRRRRRTGGGGCRCGYTCASGRTARPALTFDTSAGARTTGITHVDSLGDFLGPVEPPTLAARLARLADQPSGRRERGRRRRKKCTAIQSRTRPLPIQPSCARTYDSALSIMCFKLVSVVDGMLVVIALPSI